MANYNGGLNNAAANIYLPGAGQIGAVAANMSQYAQSTTAAPQTISSAISRMDELNGRLQQVYVQLAGIADQIGGPRSAGQASGKDQPPSISAVARLNDSADCAHSYLGEIESLLGSISRALG